MKVLELMHSLEDAYDRFGDIDIKVLVKNGTVLKELKNGFALLNLKEIIVESEEIVIKAG